MSHMLKRIFAFVAGRPAPSPEKEKTVKAPKPRKPRHTSGPGYGSTRRRASDSGSDGGFFPVIWGDGGSFDFGGGDCGGCGGGD